MQEKRTVTESLNACRRSLRNTDNRLVTQEKINNQLLDKLAVKEEEMRILHMQNIALQMMIADNYENYQIWRMTLNKEERDEWIASVKELRHNVFERWLKVTM